MDHVGVLIQITGQPAVSSAKAQREFEWRRRYSSLRHCFPVGLGESVRLPAALGRTGPAEATPQ